ncbi:OLC1v1021106C2 [Oldenlandia corymbosa var. corymbosa]|uniref:OLC1v1021106C2 n=1 Tax=Oldenlandia corymbosa var. corymbosa TaxID=529605 RepID=A0AAV1BUY0_OLDCO|nr:OLC1v1021106C2 [Oldenlandia corymbosa var. corymbosa]
MSSITAASQSPQQQQVKRILEGVEDEHGGVIVEMTKEPLDASLFTSLLHSSISDWKRQGKKGVWIKLPIELVNLVEPAVKAGFYFHHAEPSYLMLVHWLPVVANTLPANASHRVGIGAFVMNDNDEGEDICDAAVREVKEETGVDAKFVEVLAFRQSHKSFFDKSDLFFVCMLQPLSFEIQPQEAEIEAAQWMPFEEYSAQPMVQKNQLFQYVSKVCLAKKHRQYAGFVPVPVGSDPLGQETYYVYLNRQSLSGY